MRNWHTRLSRHVDSTPLRDSVGRRDYTCCSSMSIVEGLGRLISVADRVREAFFVPDPPVLYTLVPGAAPLHSRSSIAKVVYDSGRGLPPRISITSLPSPRRSRLSILRRRLLIPQTIGFVWRGVVDIPDHLVSLSHYLTYTPGAGLLPTSSQSSHLHTTLICNLLFRVHA